MTELFERASSEELGLIITVEGSVKILYNELSAHRKIAGLWPDIMLALPSDPQAIFFVKKSVELD